MMLSLLRLNGISNNELQEESLCGMILKMENQSAQTEICPSASLSSTYASKQAHTQNFSLEGAHPEDLYNLCLILKIML
jgi:hypothetical protein